MGKQGPCRHCGVTSTPLWRNGPPEKPVLCNACGSRWRTKGSLTNYTPLHSRDFDPEEPIVPKVRSISLKPREQKPFQKKQSTFHVKIEQETPYTDQNFRRSFEGDTSNRSSSGSAISYSESCVHFCATDASDLTGSAQSNVWDSLVPSKKRTCFPRPTPSPVEKLTMDLHSILHEQQSSNLSVPAEEDLLYGCETPMGSVEIDNGGVLIRYPNSKTVEEESEASSLPIDNKSYLINEAYSGSRSFLVHDEVEGTSFSNAGIEKLKKPTSQVAREHVKRDKVCREKLDILRASNSPLSSIDLKDIASFEVFMKHMTCEEQQQLMRYLPFTDNVKPPESLKSMFRSPQFIETLSYFQQLLREGVFDLSSGGNVEERRTLKRLVLLNLAKSKWLGHYKKLKDVKKQIAGTSKIATGPNFFRPFDLTPLKRHRGSQNQHCQELKGTMRCPRRVSKPGNVDLPSTKPSILNCSDAGSELICNTDDLVDEDNGACFSPRTIFASPPNQNSMLGSLQFTDESSDQDLLLDVPCNSSSSFPDAQLLFNPWNQSTAQIRDGLYNNQPSSFTSQNQRH